MPGDDVRDEILAKIRAATGRPSGGPPPQPPKPLLTVPEVPLEERIEQFSAALEKLSGKAHVAESAEAARALVEELITGRSAIASNSPLLREYGITSLTGVFTGYTDAAELKEACASADVGITGADYALADTGSLVTLSAPGEARLISLLLPVHIALVPKQRLLTGLDELFTLLPDPAAQTSSMVIITGPSRTADIEQILVKGVHGPRMVHAILV